jgi:copper resistance protein C
MRTHRSAVIPFIAATVIAAGAPAAPAHTKMKSSSPASGGTAKTTTTRVSVTFTGALRSGTLRVTGPGGTAASTGTGGRDPRNVKRLLVGLKGSLKAGSYKASWTIVAADGHRQKGSFRFRLTR